MLSFKSYAAATHSSLLWPRYVAPLLFEPHGVGTRWPSGVVYTLKWVTTDEDEIAPRWWIGNNGGDGLVAARYALALQCPRLSNLCRHVDIYITLATIPWSST
jgi:hypothetical protein